MVAGTGVGRPGGAGGGADAFVGAHGGAGDGGTCETGGIHFRAVDRGDLLERVELILQVVARRAIQQVE